MALDELRRTLAGLFIVGFKGTSVPEEVRQLMDMGLGGVILFSRNLPDFDTSAALLEQLYSAASAQPLVVSLDQEGGDIQRLGPPVLQLPPMQILAQGGADLCKRAGAQLGAELASLSFSMDYAPVLDVNSNAANPVIGQRAFSDDPQQVADLAMAFAEGLSESGVANCGKHFPGHGDTDVDSHIALPRLSHSLERLRSVELFPFSRATERNLDSIMMAHLLAASIDDKLPTSLSPAAYEILRKDLGFEGLCLTDDLEMGAVAKKPGTVEASVAAIKAGADGVLVCHQPRLVFEAIEKLLHLAKIAQMDLAALQTSKNRWDSLWKKYDLDKGPRRPDLDSFEALINSQERRLLESEINLLEKKS